MKNKLISTVTLMVALLSLCTSVYAATECMFSQGYQIDLKYTQAIKLDNIQPPAEGYARISPDYLFEPTATVTSTCNNGPDGQALQAKDNSGGEDLDQYTTEDGKQVLLFNTTTSGIYYAVGIIDGVCSEVTGFIPPDASYTTLHNVSDADDKQCMKTDTPWKFKVAFFVGTKYNPSKTGGFTSNVIGDHGAFHISGTTGDVKPYDVLVKAVQITGNITSSQ